MSFTDRFSDLATAYVAGASVRTSEAKVAPTLPQCRARAAAIIASLMSNPR